MLSQEDLDVVEAMSVPVLLGVAEECLEGTEDETNPSDVEHAVDDVFLVVEDALDVHPLVPDFLDDLLVLDVEFLLFELLDDSFVLNADDEIHGLVHDDSLDHLGQPDVGHLFLCDGVDVLDVDLVLSILGDVHSLDVYLEDLDGDALVYLHVDVVADVLNLQSQDSCQLVCC